MDETIKKKRSPSFLNKKIRLNYESKNEILEKYMPLYNIVLKSLQPPGSNHFIIDLGCGYGNFAKVLKNHGYDYEKYLGIDCSKVAIKYAVQWNPGFKFIQTDLLNSKVTKEWFNLFSDAIYVALEVLEHIVDDLAVLKMIPAGSKVILSVPNFDSGPHVRFFLSEQQAKERYSQVLDIESSEIMSVEGKSNKFFIIVGRVKE